MKNRISMALKDPILQQGFEIICKENADLKAKNKWYSEQICNKECAEVWGNLDKAKELIKTFLDFAEAFGYSPSMDKFITEAEQFLKEE